MAQVPYSPASTTTPTHEGTRGVSIEAPLSAFGGDIAKAMGQFAAQLERSGDEVFARGFALAQMDQEAKGVGGDTLFMKNTAEMRATFGELRGDQAKAALPKFLEDMENVRKQIRDGLPSPHAQRTFDRLSLPTLGRTYHAGAGHAASEFKKYVDGENTAGIQAVKEGSTVDPGSPTAIAEGIGKIEERIDVLQGTRGLGPTETAQMKAREVSDFIRKHIDATALNDPEKAQVLLDGPYGALLQDKDRQHSRVYVQTRRHQVQGAISAAAIQQGYGGHMTMKDIEKVKVLDPALQRVIERAQQRNPRLRFTVGDKGDPNGRGTELTILDDAGLPTKDPVAKARLEAEMMLAAEELGIPLDNQSLAAGVYALPPDYDSSKAPPKAKETLAQQAERAKKYAASVPGADPLFPELLERLVRGEARQAQQDQSNQDFLDAQTLGVSTMTVRRETGREPTELSQILDTPQARAAWERLVQSRPDRVKTIQDQLDRNARGDIPMTPARRELDEQLTGMFATRNPEFLDIYPMALDLPSSIKKRVIRQQEQMKRQPEVDPRIKAVMNNPVIVASLRQAGIAADQNKRQNEIFAGALQDRLIAERQATGKRVPIERAHAIALSLLQKQPRPGPPPEGFWDPAHLRWMFGRPEDPVWSMEPNQLQREQIIREYQDKFEGVTPDAATIQRLHTGKAFEKFYGPAGQPRAPQSGATPKVQERVPTAPQSR